MHPAISGEWWVMPDSMDSDLVAMMIAIAVASFAVYVCLVWLVGRRHNWARWTLLAVVAISTLFSMFDFQNSLAETPLAAGASLLFTLLEIWAFSLLFFGPGARWFRRVD